MSLQEVSLWEVCILLRRSVSLWDETCPVSGLVWVVSTSFLQGASHCERDVCLRLWA